MGYRTEEQKRLRRERYRNKEREQMRKWRAANPEKCKAYAQKARDLHPERERTTCYKSSLKRYYGLTLDQYYEMQKEQSFCCAICSSEKSGSKRCDKLFVDHCHDTGDIRGLLCMKCNMALGVLKTEDLLQKAIKYLEKYNKNQMGQLTH